MKRRSIRGKFLISVSSAVILFVLASISSVVLQSVANHKTDRIVLAERQLNLAQTLNTVVRAADDDAAWYLMSRTQQNQDKFNNAYQADLLTVSRDENDLKQGLTDASDKSDIAAFETAWASYQVGNSESFQFKQGSSSMAVSMFTQVPFDSVIQPLISFTKRTEQSVNTQEKQIHQLETLNTTIDVLATIIAALVGLATTYVFGTRIIRGFAQIRDTQEAIANGRLNVALPEIESDDELRDLALTTVDMVSQLRGLISDIEQTAALVVQSADSLSEGTTEAGDAAVGIASTLETMKDRMQAEEQSSGENAVAMQETARGIDRIAEASTRLLQASQDSLTAALYGRDMIENTTSVMQSIQGTVDSSTDEVEALGEKMHQVENIVSSIQSFAKETNLLALNAAIEAARAGDHGLGFAVVAREIRALADQSNASSKMITQLLGEIGRDAVSATQSMRKMQEAVHNGLSVVREAGGSFVKIYTQTETVNQQIEDISAVTEEISATTQEVAASVEESAQVAVETTAGYVELVETTTRQLEEIHHLGDLATGLRSAAEQLRDKIKFFAIE